MTTPLSVPQAPPSGGVRFAPSPTGRFHIGNLRTAWISHQFARALRRPWVVRFEDIDTPRVSGGAREGQLDDMASLGLVPDLALTQSSFRGRHWDAFLRGVETGRLYPCDCSRKDVQSALAGIASAPHPASTLKSVATATIYSGHCRTLDPRRALRVTDSIAWRFRQPDESGRDDFIAARSSSARDAHFTPLEETFVPAYHWACAVDDFDGNYELIVRAHDLAPALVPQRSIQNWLGELDCEAAAIPAVFHTSLILQNDGHRLEKRTEGVTLPELVTPAAGPARTAAQVLWKLQQSFDADLLRIYPENGAIFGEERQSVTLNELGL